MRVDTYGPLIENKLRRTRKGISKFEIRQAIGCTEGRVRHWFNANATRVECVGVNEHGAKLWKFREPADMRDLQKRHILPPIKVGDRLSVASMMLTDRGMTVELRDAKGETVTTLIEAKPGAGVMA